MNCSSSNNGCGCHRLEGVVVPIVTPLTASREIDREGTSRLVDFLVSGGVHGLFALGSSGEFVSLSWDKQQSLLKDVVEASAGRVVICAGISSNYLDEIVSHAADIADAGAHIAVLLPPFYFRLSQDELIRYFSHVADRSPLPVVLYNMPFRTNNNIEPATVEVLSAHPNIIGIKDTVNDMARTLDVLDRVRNRDDFVYLHGNELLSLPAILYGAKGMVPSIANFDPGTATAAYKAARAMDLSSLPLWQSRISRLMRVFELLEIRPQSSTTLRLQAIKAVLEVMGICQSHMAQLGETPDSVQMDKVREFVTLENLACLQ
jgi:dihydrodipicolinate synthase/N-acetylneuraminate lyase